MAAVLYLCCQGMHAVGRNKVEEDKYFLQHVSATESSVEGGGGGATTVQIYIFS